jgi:tRNA pseudouridine38-40 synthase
MSSPDTKLVRYKLIVSYEGTRFKGFQRQGLGDSDGNSNSKFFKRRRFENGGQVSKTPLTVQQFLEDALEQYSELSRSVIKLRFAGRTDAGVHGRGQVLAISLPDGLGELWEIRKSVNSRLPVDISVEKVSLCDNVNFDPRRDVILKRYSYTIKYRRKVFDENGAPLPISTSGPNTIRSSLDPTTIWTCPWALDDTEMDAMCLLLEGKHDFSVFVHKQARRDKDNTLTLEKLQCNRKSETDEDSPIVLAELNFESKGFRRSMVRNLVGFLVDVCRGAIDKSVFDELWKGTDEVASKIHSAPACGLCLEHVLY